MSTPSDVPMIRFYCLHCQQPLTLPLEACGKKGPCPQCGNVITAPELLGDIGGEKPARELPPGQRTLKVRRVAMGDRAAGSTGESRREVRLPKPSAAPSSGEPQQPPEPA